MKSHFSILRRFDFSFPFVSSLLQFEPGRSVNASPRRIGARQEGVPGEGQTAQPAERPERGETDRCLPEGRAHLYRFRLQIWHGPEPIPAGAHGRNRHAGAA